MDPRLIAAEVQSGVSPVCATCQKYWEARNRGIPRPKCASEEKCGSPIAGDTFSHYSGPMTDFTRWCFVCARESAHVLSVHGKDRHIGVCADHVVLVTELEAAEQTVGSPILTVGGADKIPLVQILPKKKRGLFQAIAEMEAEFQAESARKNG